MNEDAIPLEQNKMLENVFLRDKPLKILLGLKTSRKSVYVTMLSKEANCTYSHTIKILNILKDMQIVNFEKKGRIKRVTLTNFGWDIAHSMESIMKKFIQTQVTELDDEALKKKDIREKRPKRLG